MEAMSSLMASRPPTDRDGPLLNAAAATALLQPLDPMARLRWVCRPSVIPLL